MAKIDKVRTSKRHKDTMQWLHDVVTKPEVKKAKKKERRAAKKQVDEEFTCVNGCSCVGKNDEEESP